MESGMAEPSTRLTRRIVGVGLLLAVAVLAYLVGRTNSRALVGPGPYPFGSTETDTIAFNFPMQSPCPTGTGTAVDNSDQKRSFLEIYENGPTPAPVSYARIPPVIPQTLPSSPPTGAPPADVMTAMKDYAEARHLITLVKLMYQHPTSSMYNCEFTTSVTVPRGFAGREIKRLSPDTSSGCLLDGLSPQTTVCLSVPYWMANKIAGAKVDAAITWASDAVRIAEKYYLAQVP